MAKILVIEDDQSIGEMLSTHLTGEGHRVFHVQDGSSGQMLALREKPELIILDFNLPAANGATVHTRLRGNTFTAETPIIFMTAAPIGEVIVQIKNDSLTRFLNKPIDFVLLSKTVAQLLGGAAPPTPPPAKGAQNAILSSDILDLD